MYLNLVRIQQYLTMLKLYFLNTKDATKATESPCIRCAKCLRACPKGLNPIKLMELWERG